MADCDGATLGRRPEGEFGGAFARTPDQAWKRLRLIRAAVDYASMGDSIQSQFDSLSSTMDTATRRAMQGRIDSLKRELRRLDRDVDFRRTSGPTPRLFEIDAGDVDNGDPWRLTSVAGTDSVVVTTATSEGDRRAICWTALFARSIADAASAEARANTLKFVAARANRWDNYERVGYSLTPIELFINSYCGFCRAELEPPRVQIVAGHISPMYLVGRGSSSRPAIGIEAGGLLLYTSSRSAYFGASLLYAFPQDTTRHWGLMMHWSAVGQLGVVKEKSFFSKGAKSTIIVSADLYKVLEVWTGRIRDERDAIRSGIAKLRASLP